MVLRKSINQKRNSPQLDLTWIAQEISKTTWIRLLYNSISLSRYQSLQDKFSPKAEMAKSELNQAINHFEQSQVS